MAYDPQTWVDGSGGGTPLSATRLSYMETGIEDADTRLTSAETNITALQATSGGNPFGTLFRTLASFTGATDSARFRQALTDFPSASPKWIVIIPGGTTLDSGANNPFIIPTGFHTMGVPGVVDETGYQCTVNLRHTASTTTLGTFQWASGSRDQKFSGITFKGTASVRAFVDVALDGSDGRFPQYVTFDNISFNQFESVMQATGTGVKWMGACFINNMACTRPPFYFAGSDHTMWSNGCLMEMGLVGSYATRSALEAMFRTGSLSNTSVGPIYWTGSPTTPVRVDGGAGGLNFTDGVLEGRPSSGTVGGDIPTDGLHCNGPLARVTAGRVSFRNREHGYAMRDPRSSVHGYQPGGFYHIAGGAQVVIDGGSFNPYVNTVYPAYTDPAGAAVAVDTIPPIAWVTGAGTTLNISKIIRGPNASALPVVKFGAGTTVIADGSVNPVAF